MSADKNHDSLHQTTASDFHPRPIRSPDLSASENQRTTYATISTVTCYVYLHKPVVTHKILHAALKSPHEKDHCLFLQECGCRQRQLVEVRALLWVSFKAFTLFWRSDTASGNSRKRPFEQKLSMLHLTPKSHSYTQNSVQVSFYQKLIY